MFEIATEWADSDNKREQVRRTKVYIENHWEAIIIPNSDENGKT